MVFIIRKAFSYTFFVAPHDNLKLNLLFIFARTGIDIRARIAYNIRSEKGVESALFAK